MRDLYRVLHGFWGLGVEGFRLLGFIGLRV